MNLLTGCQITLNVALGIIYKTEPPTIFRVKLQLGYLPTAFEYYTMGSELGMKYVLYRSISAFVNDKRGFLFLVEASGWDMSR